MNRRNLVLSIASLPLMAAMPSIGLAGMDCRGLIAARDLLLPGLRAISKSHPGIELDIQTQFSTGSLLMTGYNPANKRLLGFAITNKAITDGLYKAQFAPSCQALVACLIQKDIDDRLFS